MVPARNSNPDTKQRLRPLPLPVGLDGREGETATRAIEAMQAMQLGEWVDHKSRPRRTSTARLVRSRRWSAPRACPITTYRSAVSSTTGQSSTPGSWSDGASPIQAVYGQDLGLGRPPRTGQTISTLSLLDAEAE